MTQAIGSFVKPPALRPGARIAVLSPASTPKEDRVQAGIARLTELGYQPVLYPSALAAGPLYYAGTVQQRVADLHSAFADSSIAAIVCSRGGWGSAELLPHLDAAMIRANPKPFVGYSDHTSLHIFLATQCGLVTFYGPMVAADFARTNGVDLPSWTHALTDHQPWDLTTSDGLRTLQPGTAEGTLTGGCISIFAEALGTPYAMPSAAADTPRILFLEDIGTKPYQWDRMLLHLRYASMLEHVTGIVFGDMRQCVAPEQDELLAGAIRHALGNFLGPIAIGLRSGHVDTPNVTLPLGISAHLNLTDPAGPRLTILEPAVSG